MGPGWQATAGYDAVRASLDDGTPLPRIPARRGRLGVRHQHGAWQAGAEVVRTGRQARTFAFETPTAGATIPQLFGAWSFVRGGAVHTITARLDNLTDRLYRNHLSFIKAFVPERGRDLRVTWAVEFGR